MPVNDYLAPLVACTLTDTIICLDTMLIRCCLLNTIIVIIIEFLDFLWSLLCCTLVLVLGIGIVRGQYYWVLDIWCLSWYHSNPKSMLVCLQQTGNANSCKMVKATVFTFGVTCFQGQSPPHDPVKTFEKERRKGHVDP